MLDFAIVGAGMVGCATALALKKRGFSVEIWEGRDDPRVNDRSAGRSINLALSARGLASLEAISPQIAEQVRPHLVPMYGRMVHTPTGGLSSVRYGITGSEAIQSVGRAVLNALLLDAASAAEIPIHFGSKIESVRFGRDASILVLSSGMLWANGPSVVSDSNPATEQLVSDSDSPENSSSSSDFSSSSRSVTARTIVGADGTWSLVRSAVNRVEDSQLQLETVGTYYIEIPISKTSELDRNHLHIWPRGSFMFIALPNADGSFTGTLFASPEQFSGWATATEFRDWFQHQFPDAYTLVTRSELDSAYSRPRGRLTSVKTWPYNHGDRAVYIGDAAHAMVPFYGQGLNCGLEDVRVLMEFIDAHPGDLRAALNTYSHERKADLDAINDLSMRNYAEMSNHVATTLFRIRKFVDTRLARWLGNRWLPLYTMVSFRADVPYSTAIQEDARQTALLETVIGLGGATTLAAAAACAYAYFRRL